MESRQPSEIKNDEKPSENNKITTSNKNLKSERKSQAPGLKENKT